jgi:hypothetical protein
MSAFTALRARALMSLVALLVATVGTGMPAFSSAAFTSQSVNPGNSVAAAADWTPPTVAIKSPGTSVARVVTVTATATDDVSGVASVVVQYRAAGGSTWTTLCTATASPYTCSWDTRTVADGSYSLRATATDKAGNTAISASVSTLVDNTPPSVVLADPGSPLSGVITLTASASDTGSGVAQTTLSYAPSGTSTWTTVCQAPSSPYSCSLDTGTLPNGSYDFRAIATDNAGNASAASIVTGRQVSNTDLSFGGVGPATTLTSSGTATVAYPSGTVQGDLLLLVEVNSASQNIVDPSGWTSLADQQTSSPAQFRYTVWWRSAGTETSVPVQAYTNSSGATFWVIRYGKSSGSTAVALAAATMQQGMGGAQTSITPSPDISTNGAARVISIVATRAPNSLSLLSARTFAFRSSRTGVAGNPATTIGIADTWVSSASTPASPTWTQSGSPGQWAWATVAFR